MNKLLNIFTYSDPSTSFPSNLSPYLPPPFPPNLSPSLPSFAKSENIKFNEIKYEFLIITIIILIIIIIIVNIVKNAIRYFRKKHFIYNKSDLI